MPEKFEDFYERARFPGTLELRRPHESEGVLVMPYRYKPAVGEPRVGEFELTPKPEQSLIEHYVAAARRYELYMKSKRLQVQGDFKPNLITLTMSPPTEDFKRGHVRERQEP